MEEKKKRGKESQTEKGHEWGGEAGKVGRRKESTHLEALKNPVRHIGLHDHRPAPPESPVEGCKKKE